MSLSEIDPSLDQTPTPTTTPSDTPVATPVPTSTPSPSPVQVLGSFEIGVPDAPIAGSPFNIQVTALDTLGNPMPDFSDVVTFSTDDAQAIEVPSDTAFAADINGVDQFEFTLCTARIMHITVQSGDISHTTSVLPVAAPAVALVFSHLTISTSGAPIRTYADGMYSAGFQVSAVDPWNNVDPNIDEPVYLEISTDGSGRSASLLGDTSGPMTLGKSIFSNTKIDFAGTGYVLSASLTTVSGTLTGTSNSFNIGADPTPAYLTIRAGDHQIAQVGTSLFYPLSVLVTDLHHNAIAGSPVDWNTNHGINALPIACQSNNVTGINGVASCYGFNPVSGVNQVTATIPGTGISATFNIVSTMTSPQA